ncbi:MAG: hypothetical protein IT165_12860 [Bryobacterales bacterium]|nr:hypothetical protein [Bryobacterales bacterium]
MPMRGLVLGFLCLSCVLAQTKGPIHVQEPPPEPDTPPSLAPSPPPRNTAETKAETKEAKKEPPKPARQPCIADSEDSSRPVLRRGKPTTKDMRPDCETLPVVLGETESVDSPGAGPSTASTFDRPAAATARQPVTLIDKVRMKAETYSERLPDFICQQLIRRNQSGSTLRDWRLKDTVQVDVMYVDGHEDYRNARHNGKPVKYEDTQKSGAWSEGEYGTVLRDLMNPGTDARFTYRRSETIGGVNAEVYDYVVQQPNSHWTLKFGGQELRPKYRGSVWIDAKELTVRRIEMQARDMPPSFALDQAEMSLEYNPVRIGEKFYLLPFYSANLACFRAERACVKNEIEFRNYRKFSAETTISTTDSSVTFDGDDKKAPEKKK